MNFFCPPCTLIDTAEEKADITGEETNCKRKPGTEVYFIYMKGNYNLYCLFDKKIYSLWNGVFDLQQVKLKCA